MKRALAITMTIALLGSLMFMGFAGTAAAGSYDDKHDKDKHNDKYNDKNDEPKDKNDEPKDKNDEPKDKNDEPKDKNDEPKDKNDEPKDKNDEPKDKHDVPKDHIADQFAHAETNQYQKIDQSNYLKQGDNYAVAYKGTANAGNFAAQSNANAQVGASTAINA